MTPINSRLLLLLMGPATIIADQVSTTTPAASNARLSAEQRLTAPADPAPQAARFLARHTIEILPYTGGYPRLTHDETCIDPLNDHKLQVNLPWKDAGYVVVDVPEAIFSNIGLLFLGHKHIPTIWEQKGIRLETATWSQQADGSLVFTRILPNNVAFGVSARAGQGFVDMQLWLENRTDQPLTGLRCQICVLLARAVGFDQITRDNKFFYTHEAGWLSYRNVEKRSGDLGIYGLGFKPAPARVDAPMVAVVSNWVDGLHPSNHTGGTFSSPEQASHPTRWIATVWDHCNGLPNNPLCPCMHSDPVLPDCRPGQRVSARGKLFFIENDLASFYSALAGLKAPPSP